jgi:hypothetical protein
MESEFQSIETNRDQSQNGQGPIRGAAPSKVEETKFLFATAGPIQSTYRLCEIYS